MTWLTWFLLGMLAGALAARLLPRLPRQGQVRVRRLGHHPRVLTEREWREVCDVQHNSP